MIYGSGSRTNWRLNGAMPESKPEAMTSSTGMTSSLNMTRVILTGFMGAGKSTVGPLLAARLGWQFVDADRAIEAAYGTTITALFAEHGEPWFREVERATILEFLGIDHLVLALGGGAVEDTRTLEAMLASPGTRLVHLDASFETVLERCRGTEASRPVLQDRLQLESRYARRRPLYRQAHLNVPVDGIDAETAAETVLNTLSSLPALG